MKHLAALALGGLSLFSPHHARPDRQQLADIVACIGARAATLGGPPPTVRPGVVRLKIYQAYRTAAAPAAATADRASGQHDAWSVLLYGRHNDTIAIYDVLLTPVATARGTHAGAPARPRIELGMPSWLTLRNGRWEDGDSSATSAVGMAGGFFRESLARRLAHRRATELPVDPARGVALGDACAVR